ncbi:hypothetical protein, partial [Sphingobium aromaticivastans]|uniref:hypothetical protein n=1 Tax=Sphingobium aromaticivastans TaxID=1778665 RepID=UPI00301B5F11
LHKKVNHKFRPMGIARDSFFALTALAQFLGGLLCYYRPRLDRQIIAKWQVSTEASVLVLDFPELCCGGRPMV